MQLLKLLAFSLLSFCPILGQAHYPFLTPQSYIVEGGNTSVLAGFAELPLASEVALNGFKFYVITPDGENKALEIQQSKSLTISNIATEQEGTYTVYATRDNTIEYAKAENKWFRVMPNRGGQLPPLMQRTFITPDEISEKTQQVKTIRYEKLVTYLTKNKLTEQTSLPKMAGLDVIWSQHPNSLTTQSSVDLTIKLDDQVQKDYRVDVRKQVSVIGETVLEQKYTSDQYGKLKINFPKSGQYVIEVNSPDTEQPQVKSYRQFITVNVN